MLYLLDTSVLIEAKNKYYPIERVPQFWSWLDYQSRAGNVKLPPQVIGEILGPDRPDDVPVDDLAEWVTANRCSLEFSVELNPDDLSCTYSKGYGMPLSDVTGIDSIFKPADPFLVAYALASPENRCVVTMENVQKVGKNLPKPHNRKIPLVCDRVGVRHMDTFQLIRELDFRIVLAN